jgi:hypothetical protein
MPVSRDLGQFFVMPIWVDASAPLAHRAPTREIEAPFRVSLRSIVLRLWPLRRALVVGRWHPSGLSEEEALQAAVAGHEVGLSTVVDDGTTIIDNCALPLPADWTVVEDQA